MSTKKLRKGGLRQKSDMLDKKASKMVEEVRLQTIEKEYKSSGTLLDTRHLFRLDDTNAGRERAQAKLDVQKRVDSRRGARGHDEIKKTAEATIDKMIAKGDTIVKTSNFDNEELIWATKSSDPNYVKKRKYDDPELHKFKMNLDPDQKKVYKVLCQEALIDLATKYREDMNQIKADMDISGIFHPDANAHRAHCMYLMRLYNTITADTIEDPVLRRMRSDIEEKERLVNAEERRQKRLISQIERKNKKESEQERLAREAAEKEEDDLIAREEDDRLSKLKGTAKRSARVSLLELAKPKHSSSRRESIKAVAEQRASMKRSLSQRSVKPGGGLIRNPTMHGKSHPGGKDTLADFGDGRAGILDDDLSSKNQSSMEETSLASSSVSGAIGEDDAGKGVSAADQKLFTKMKRGKLGNADPASLLTEEARKLQEAETREHKKPWDRSKIVGAKVGEWMMGLLQTSQINRTGEGSSNAPEATGLLPTGSVRNDSMDSPAKRTRPPGGGEYDPQQIVPFKDFNEMFRTFSEEQMQQEQAEARQRELQRQEEELLEQQRRAQEEEEEAARAAQAQAEAEAEAGAGAEDEGEGKPDGETKTGEGQEEGEGADAEAKQEKEAEVEEGEGPAAVQTEAVVLDRLLSEMAGGDGYNEDEEEIGAGAAKWAPTDTLLMLEEADPQYQAYVKMMRRQNPAGRRLFRGKSTKKAKGRPAAPLGQKAVTMLDSRGAATGDSAKGFKNVFREAHATEDSDTDDDDDEDEDLHSQVTNDSSTFVGDADHADIGAGLDGPVTPASTPAATGTDAALNVSSEAKLSTPGTQRAGRSPSRGSSRGRTGSRGRRRPRAGAASDAEAVALGADAEEDMQKKLMRVFDSLQVPAMSRLSFMRKFAGTRATQFNLAIDMFGEAAVLVLARQHVVQRAYIALKEGFAVLPLIADRLIAPFRDSVPRILTSRNVALRLQQTHADMPMEPASALMYSAMEDLLHSMFPNDRVNDAPDNMMTPESAKELLNELEERVEVLIDDVKARIAEQLNEPLEMNGEEVDSWLKKLKRVVNPPPPSKPTGKEGETREEKENKADV